MRLFNFCVCLWRLQLRRATRVNIDGQVAEHGDWHVTGIILRIRIFSSIILKKSTCGIKPYLSNCFITTLCN